MLLLPITALVDYLLGTSIGWSVWTFVEIGVASVLYAVLMHYFAGGNQSSDGGSSSGPNRPPVRTRSPR